MDIRIGWHLNHAKRRPAPLQKIRGQKQVKVARGRVVKEIRRTASLEVGRLVGLVNRERCYPERVCGNLFWQGTRLDGLDYARRGWRDIVICARRGSAALFGTAPPSKESQHQHHSGFAERRQRREPLQLSLKRLLFPYEQGKPQEKEPCRRADKPRRCRIDPFLDTMKYCFDQILSSRNTCLLCPLPCSVRHGGRTGFSRSGCGHWRSRASNACCPRRT